MAPTMHLRRPPAAGAGPNPRATRRTSEEGGRRWLWITGIGLITVHLLLVALTSDLSWVGRVAAMLVMAGLMGAAVWLSLGARPGRRGLGLLLGGLAGTAAGGGVGIVHLVATGVSAPAVLGTLALAAGLVLLVAGSLVATRALPAWWRLLALPVALVVVQLVLLTLPFALYATHVPIAPFDADVPAGATAVVVPTADDVDLAAWYTPSVNGAAVILRHGSGSASSKASTTAHAQVLADHGYGVLAMDARGHGESGGQAMDWGWYGDADVAAGIAWLAARPEVDPERIGGVGLSMGGEELIGAMAASLELRAVVAEGATGRGADDRAHLGYTGLRGLVDGLSSAITFGAADLLTRATAPTPLEEAVAAMGDREALLIAGAPAEEALTAAHLQAVATGPTQVWEVGDAGHIAALRVHPEEWEQRVIGFLHEALGG